MIDAFKVAYPGSRSLAGQVFRPIVTPWTYVRAAHLMVMFPLGIAYFVSLVVLLAVGGSLIWTIPGALILIATIFLSRLVGDFESLVVGNTAGVEIKRPPWRTEGVQSWRSRLWVRMIDPTTWTGILYLFVQFPLGIGAFVSLVVAFSVAGSLTAAPIIIQFTNDTLDLDFAGFTIVMDEPVEALWLVPIGLVLFLITAHVVTVLSALHATWARFMLGTRAGTTGEISPNPVSPDSGSGGSGEVSDVEGGSQERGQLKQFSHPPSPVVSFQEGPRPSIAEARPHYGEEVTAHWEPVLPESLTPRESEILLLMARGLSNADIAEQSFISQGTVKTHVKRILAKLDLHDRVQVVVYAYETGLVVPRTDHEQTSAGRASS